MAIIILNGEEKTTTGPGGLYFRIKHGLYRDRSDPTVRQFKHNGRMAIELLDEPGFWHPIKLSDLEPAASGERVSSIDYIEWPKTPCEACGEVHTGLHCPGAEEW